MTIAEAREKCKSLCGGIPRDLLIVIILILTAFFAFGLGYLAGRDAGQGSAGAPVAVSVVASTTEQRFVASRSGTRFYPIACAGAARISDANKVWFSSTEAARAAGYVEAAHCD